MSGPKLSSPWTRGATTILAWILSAVTPAAEMALTPLTYERLVEIRSLMERDLNQQAVDQLKSLVARSRNRPYDRAIVQQHLGHAYVALQDYPAACAAIEASLQARGLPDDVVHNQRFFLAQLYLQAEDQARALRVIEDWLQAESNPEPHAHAVAAQIYYATGDDAKALEQIGQALDKSERPPEPWYHFLIGLYLKNTRYAEAEPVIHRAIAAYPSSTELWRNLANVHMAMEGGHKALAALMLAYRQGMLNTTEHERLIQFVAHMGVPEKAGRLLSQWRRDGTLKNSVALARLEARLWAIARERRKAIQVLAGLSDRHRDVNTNLLLGQLLVGEENWSEAIRAFLSALSAEKLNRDDRDRAQLLLGMASYRADNRSLSRDAFEKLRDHPHFGETARHWLSVVEGTDSVIPEND